MIQFEWTSITVIRYLFATNDLKWNKYTYSTIFKATPFWWLSGINDYSVLLYLCSQWLKPSRAKRGLRMKRAEGTEAEWRRFGRISSLTPIRVCLSSFFSCVGSNFSWLSLVADFLSVDQPSEEWQAPKILPSFEKCTLNNFNRILRESNASKSLSPAL